MKGSLIAPLVLLNNFICPNQIISLMMRMMNDGDDDEDDDGDDYDDDSDDDSIICPNNFHHGALRMISSKTQVQIIHQLFKYFLAIFLKQPHPIPPHPQKLKFCPISQSNGELSPH